MKFYRTIVPVILCVIYTTTIFGPPGETTLPYVTKVIWDLIDEFRGKVYKETCHIKPYSRRLDLMTRYARQPIEDESPIQRNATPTNLVVTLLSLSGLSLSSHHQQNKFHSP